MLFLSYFFILMAIMGGGIKPKLMGHIADTSKDGMSAGVILLGAMRKLSGSEGVLDARVTRGH